MEKSTSNTFLYHSTDGQTFTKLIDITSYPDILSSPERVDISDLSSKQKKYTQGMIDVPEYEFGFIYNKVAYEAVKALEDGKTDHHYQIRFGTNGEYGAWAWTGSHFATVTGAGVGSARTGKIVCYPESEIETVTIAQNNQNGEE